MSESQQYDLAIVGAGYAGLVAANRAMQLGRRVVVLEKGKGELYPCNSRYAAGVLHISYHTLDDPQAELVKAVREITDGFANLGLAEALAATALRAAKWLEAEGTLFDRTNKTPWRRWVLAPARPTSTQMDWKDRGADVTLRLLEGNFARGGGTLHKDTRVLRLMMSGGRCVGVEAERNGKRENFAAGAVLLADGGYQANLELLGKYISPAPKAIKQRCAETGTGDGLRMAQEIGAGTIGLEAFYGHLLSRDAMHNDALWPYPQVDEVASSGILVDGAGHRFADEGNGGVFLANAVARLADPLGASAVFDENIWQSAGRAAAVPPNPRLAGAGGTIHQAATIADLAGKSGLPANELEATLKRYNEAVASGRIGALDVPRSARRHAPAQIVQPPFYAIPICTGITFTMGGIVIDPSARVLRPDRSPIPGLYAAGSSVGGLDGGAVCGYAGGLIKAIVFGMLAAEHLAGHASAAG